MPEADDGLQRQRGAAAGGPGRWDERSRQRDLGRRDPSTACLRIRPRSLCVSSCQEASQLAALSTRLN